MAITIELWVEERLVSGIEHWWDDVETALGSESADFPLLSGVDPYGEVRLQEPFIGDLSKECRALAVNASSRLQPFLLELADLADKGARAGNAEVRFIGD